MAGVYVLLRAVAGFLAKSDHFVQNKINLDFIWSRFLPNKASVWPAPLFTCHHYGKLQWKSKPSRDTAQVRLKDLLRMQLTAFKSNSQAYILRETESSKGIYEIYDLEYESLTLLMELTWVLWTWEGESLTMYSDLTTGPHLRNKPSLIRNSFL